MTMRQLLTSLRETHQDCCLSTNCKDHGCSINLRGINSDALLIIHGERYRDEHGDSTSKIADRIIISDSPKLVAAVIELKGGNSIRRRDIRDAVEQVKMGVTVIERLLAGRRFANLIPRLFLAYSGRISRQDATYLRNNRISFRGSPLTLLRVDCDSWLGSLLSIAN